MLVDPIMTPSYAFDMTDILHMKPCSVNYCLSFGKLDALKYHASSYYAIKVIAYLYRCPNNFFKKPGMLKPLYLVSISSGVLVYYLSAKVNYNFKCEV